MGRKVKQRKPNKQELHKMERIKTLLESEGSKQNITTVSPVQHKVAPNVPALRFENTTVPIKQISCSLHAIKRSKERLGCKTDEQAVGELRKILRNAKCIGKVYDKYNNESILFAKDGVGVYLKPDLSEINTVIKHEKIHKPILNTIQQIHEKEIRKLTRKENARTKQLTELKLEADCIIAEMELRKYRTRSQSVKMACTARINAINERLLELENEIKSIRDTKRLICRSMTIVC